MEYSGNIMWLFSPFRDRCPGQYSAHLPSDASHGRRGHRWCIKYSEIDYANYRSSRFQQHYRARAVQATQNQMIRIEPIHFFDPELKSRFGGGNWHPRKSHRHLPVTVRLDYQLLVHLP